MADIIWPPSGTLLQNKSNSCVENPIAPGRGSITGRVAIECRPVHVVDVLADPEYKLHMQGHRGYRTTLGVPLLRDGVAIGIIVLTHEVVQPFTDKQIELVTTFADQALIAIENARLFEEVQARTREVSEALEQQTATSEVLQVISSSPGELGPVFRAMLENAVRICEARFGYPLKHYERQCASHRRSLPQCPARLFCAMAPQARSL